jgi:hypothetical protein
MAKIPPFCDYANAITSLLHEARREDARKKAAEYLRDGVSSPLLLALVADEWLDPAPPRRGRPPGIRDLVKIGERFEDLTACGSSYEQALHTVGAEFSRTPDAIEKIVAKYRTAWNEAHED